MTRTLCVTFLFPALLGSICQAAFAADKETTYKLRYKFRTGDVIRYAVDHRASIRSTIDDTTQSAQTRTESTAKRMRRHPRDSRTPPKQWVCR